MKKSRLIVGIIILLMVIIGVSYAYFTGMIVGEGKKITVTANKLAIIFTDSKKIVGNEIMPGWNVVKEFTVENKSNDTFFYNINIDKLINTFETVGFLQYKITSDKGYNMEDFKNISKSEEERREILASEILIRKEEIHTYKVEFRYLNSEEDQSIDMGKLFNGSLSITEANTKLNSVILANNPNRLVRTDFEGIIDDTYGENPLNGTLYEEKDTRFTENGTVYYFVGDTRNNWVHFGGYYWRIIRINEDGSIRLIYVGDKHDTSEGYIGISTYNGNKNDEGSYKNTRYIGYMFGKDSNDLEGNRINNADSTIKTVIDEWYEKNLLIKYDKYISRTAIYCNDRSGGTYSTNDLFSYASDKRVGGKSDNSPSYGNVVRPSYKCGVKNDGTLFLDASEKDKFSGINNEAILKYPIALLTIDEYIYAGGQFDGVRINLSNENLWLNRNSKNILNEDRICENCYYYTMSPAMNYAGFLPYMHGIHSSSHTGFYHIYDKYVIRPVLSIKSCTEWSSGNGSYNNPYKVKINRTCISSNN